MVFLEDNKFNLIQNNLNFIPRYGLHPDSHREPNLLGMTNSFVRNKKRGHTLFFQIVRIIRKWPRFLSRNNENVMPSSRVFEAYRGIIILMEYVKRSEKNRRMFESNLYFSLCSSESLWLNSYSTLLFL